MMLGLEDEETFLKSQVGFFGFMLKPLFRSVTRLWPKLNFLYLGLANNERFICNELDKIEDRRQQLKRCRSSTEMRPWSSDSRLRGDSNSRTNTDNPNNPWPVGTNSISKQNV